MYGHLMCSTISRLNWDLNHVYGILIIFPQDFVLSVSVSNDGRWVVSGSKDRSVHFWDAHSGALQLTLQGHKNSG